MFLLSPFPLSLVPCIFLMYWCEFFYDLCMPIDISIIHDSYVSDCNSSTWLSLLLLLHDTEILKWYPYQSQVRVSRYWYWYDALSLHNARLCDRQPGLEMTRWHSQLLVPVLQQEISKYKISYWYRMETKDFTEKWLQMCVCLLILWL